MVKTLAVRYKAGEFGDGFWSVRETERSADRKNQPGLEASDTKTRLSSEVLVADPQLRR